MSYTTISQLDTTGLEPGEIEKGEGYYREGFTFFYYDDIKKILEQEGVGEVKLKNLRLVNIVFERENDEEINHERSEICGLALRKPQEMIDQQDPSESKWFDIIALPWPVYYKRDTTTAVDEDNKIQKYIGKPFDGSLDFHPGTFLSNSDNE